MLNPGGPGPGETRNVFIAIALSAAILFGFEFFYNAPQRERLQAEERARIEATQPAASAESQAAETPAAAAAPIAREQVLAQWRARAS